MVQINWGMAGGAQNGFQNALQQGMQMGAMARQAKEEREYKNALAGYAENPTREGAVGMVQYNPQFGMQEIARFGEQEQAAELARDTELAMGGDQEAAQRVRARSFDRWKSIDEHTRRQAKEESAAHGQAALYALTLDPALRRQAVVNYAQQTGDPDIDRLAQLPDAQLEAALQRAVFEAELVNDLDRMTSPDWTVYDPTQTVVDMNNPDAVRALQEQRAGQGIGPTPQAGQGPQPGAIEDGYRFRGGNPADPNNWEPVGGSGGNAAGVFPGN